MSGNLHKEEAGYAKQTNNADVAFYFSALKRPRTVGRYFHDHSGIHCRRRRICHKRFKLRCFDNWTADGKFRHQRARTSDNFRFLELFAPCAHSSHGQHKREGKNGEWGRHSAHDLDSLQDGRLNQTCQDESVWVLSIRRGHGRRNGGHRRSE